MKRLIWLVLLVVASCGTPYVLRHSVASGETAASIARDHGMSEQRFRELNHLGPEDRLRPGDTVFVPGTWTSAERTPSAAPPRAGGEAPAPRVRETPPAALARPRREAPPRVLAPPVTRRPPPPPREPPPPAVKELAKSEPPGRKALLSWPLRGEILRGFGRGPAGENRGIDIAAPAGTEVRAAAAGRVTYAGSPTRAYGPIVILEHGDGLDTVYANLQHLTVRRGEEVSAGQPIGTSGAKASPPLPHLHFEVRKNGDAVDPLLFLPTP